MFKKIATLCVAALLASAAAARADVVYALDVSGCSTTCNPAPSSNFGSVTLHDLTSSEFSVTVTLNGTETFANSSGNPLEFNFSDLSGNYIVTNLTSGFSFAGYGPYTAPSLTSPPTDADKFEFAIECGSACPHGATGTANTLTFDITNTAGNLPADLASLFPATGKGFYFASDIFVNGNTGNVGADGGTPTNVATPEPSSLMLLGTGIVGAASMLRRRIAAKV